MNPYESGGDKGEQVRAMFDSVAHRYDRLNHLLSLGIDRLWRRRVARMVARRLAETGAAVGGRRGEPSEPTPSRGSSSLLEWPRREGGRPQANIASSPTGAGSSRVAWCRSAEGGNFPQPVRAGSSEACAGAAILDVATGTGDMAIALAHRCPGARITGVDVSPNMLAIGREKVARAGLSDSITLLEGSAEALPLPDKSFAAATVAFGVRNFSDIAAGLREIHRVLGQGGGAYILEFATPRVKIFGYLYRWYFHRVVPRVGGMISGDRRAYAYLPASVDEFPAPERFLDMMRQAGFGRCNAKRVFFGIAMIYNGTKI